MKKKANKIIDKIQGVILFGTLIAILLGEAPIGIFLTYVSILIITAAASGIIRGAINGR